MTFSITINELRILYLEWCAKHGHVPAPLNVFEQKASARGYKVTTTAESPRAEALPQGPAFMAASAAVDPSKATAWLWQGVLPFGALTLLTGQPKVGKSQIAVAMAAVTSAGGTWPTGQMCEPGGVILAEVEDSFADTQARLMAAGANLGRIAVRDREAGPLDLSGAEGMAILTGQAEAMGGVKLVVLSPLLTFFGKAGATDDAIVRGRLSKLQLWAAQNRVAVLGIMHPSKNPGKALEGQFAGADGYRRSARSAFVAMPDASDPEPIIKRKRRVLVCAGVNGWTDDQRYFYQIESATAGNLPTSRVVWLPEIQTAELDEFLNGEPDDDAIQTDIERGCEIIDEMLPIGSSRPAIEIKTVLYEAGLSKGTIGRAAKRMDVQSEDNGVGKSATWRR